MIISVICEKGGTGKTTIAREVYYALLNEGIPTSLYSLDGQYKNASIKDPDAKIAVIDTAGVLTEQLKDVLDSSDLVLIPVRPSPRDFEPFLRTLEMVKGAKKQFLVIVNGANRFKMCKSFLTYLDQNGIPYLQIPQSELVVQMSAEGKNFSETARYSAPGMAFRKLKDWIKEKLCLTSLTN